MIPKLDASIKFELRRAHFADGLRLVKSEYSSAYGCYFASTKYKSLAYRLMLRRDVFTKQIVIMGQKGIRKKDKPWKWTNLSAQWKIDALLALAWPDWSPDDAGLG